MANSPARSIDVGTVIAGTYTIDALIGRGGMGAVFLASHNRLPGKKVAIKLLHADISTEDVLARFKREADIASRLDHPNIVKVDDYDVLEDGTPYIRMEYLQGEALSSRLQRGPLAMDQAMSITRQVGSALAAAHRAGIVHRDLKPQNIFLVPTEVEGESREIAKVLDFGISKIRGSTTVKTQDSALLGTPQYMAPEQATGQHDKVDERTDVFALGAIVYEMLSGRPAFQGASIPEVVFKVVYEQPAPLDGVAPELAAVVARAMAKPQEERYATIADFVEALTGRPLTVSRASAAQPGVDGPTTGSRVKSSGNDAFARTMGSGDHAEAALAAPAREAAAAAPVRGSAPTVDSQSPAARVAPAAQPRRRAGLIVGAIVVVGIAGAGAMYFVMRGSNATTVVEEDKRGSNVRAPDTRGADNRIADNREPDKGLPDKGLPDKGLPDKGLADKPLADKPLPDKPLPDKQLPDKPLPDKRLPDKQLPDKQLPDKQLSDKRPESNRESDAKPPLPDARAGVTAAEVEDETAAKKLADAEAALKAHEDSRAERLANAVINGDAAGPGQKQHAYAIHGIAMCAANNDQERAQIDLRHVRLAKLRHRVIEACHTAGIPIAP